MLNIFNQILQTSKGRFALFLGIAAIIIGGVALYIGFDEQYIPNGEVSVEAPRTKAEQKLSVKQTKTSFGAVNNLTKNVLSLNSEIADRSLTQEEKYLKLANLAGIAKQRKTFVKELMKENPRVFLTTAIRKNQRAALSQEIQKDVEQETTITAKIGVLHIDDFKNPENSRFEYTLQTKDAKLSFYPTNELYLVSGAEVKVSGFQLDDVIVSDINKNNFQIIKEAPSLESVGDQKTLVLLVNFFDSPPVPFTREQVYSHVFESSFQAFYQEQSYGKISFSGDVLDWYRLNRNIGNFLGACGAVNDSDLETVVVANNVDLNNYARIVIVPNFTFGGGGCSFIGKIDIEINNRVYRLSEAFVGTTSFESVGAGNALTHEMGHGLGLYHANGWDCGDKVLYGDCQHIEYGNYFDVMGIGLNSLHFNAFFKELLGWIEPEKTLLISESGRYTINPLETEEGIKLAKVQPPHLTEALYYLENRKGIGFDSTLNLDKDFIDADGKHFALISNQEGLLINNIKVFNYLLDLSPTSLPWREDIRRATLNGQNVFADPDNGITIGPIISTSTSSITFDVKIENPVCIAHEPSILQMITDDEYVIDKRNRILIEFENQNSFKCSSAEFNVNLMLPSDWVYEALYKNNITLNPGESGWFEIYIIPHNADSGQDYSIEYSVTNLNNGLSVQKFFSVRARDPLLISSIDPSSGPIGTEAVLSGSGFDRFVNSVSFFNIDLGYNETHASLENDGTLKFLIPYDLHDYKCIEGFCGGSTIPTPPGVYRVEVHSLYDQSNPVDFEVIELKPLPPLSITAPKDGDIVAPKSKVNIIAEISDKIKDKTKRVEFYVNGKRKCMDKGAPYSCDWQVPKKSGQIYELQVKAFDKAKKGNIIVESAIITVTAR